MRRNRKWVVCSICHRKYLADKDTDYPKKHFTPPAKLVVGDVTYLINTSWMSDREICKGTYEKGEPIK